MLSFSDDIFRRALLSPLVAMFFAVTCLAGNATSVAGIVVAQQPASPASESEAPNVNPDADPASPQIEGSPEPDATDSETEALPDSDSNQAPAAASEKDDVEPPDDDVDLPQQTEPTSALAAPTVSTAFLFNGEAPKSVDQLQVMQQHFADLAEQVAPATVNIQIGMAQGSGVVVSQDGYVLTAAHVTGRPNADATITFPDGKQVKAKSLGMERNIDSGMLKILESEGDRFPYLNVGLSSDIQEGQWVMAVGHPGGMDEQRGLVFRAGRVIFSTSRVIRTDCTLVGGDSGGPLVDMNGDVIGIHSRIGSRLWDNLHVPIDKFSDHWDELDAGIVLDGRAGKLEFNVRGDTNRVEDVTGNGPADKAGLKKGDKIVKINSTEISDKKDLERAIARLRPFEKLTIEVERRGKTIELDLVLGEQ